MPRMTRSTQARFSAGELILMKTTCVADAMLRRPTVHRADLTVGEARGAFDASPKTQLLLLVTQGMLLSTITRGDLMSVSTSPCQRRSWVHSAVEQSNPMSQWRRHWPG
jgi:hypothetical protein